MAFGVGVGVGVGVAQMNVPNPEVCTLFVHALGVVVSSRSTLFAAWPGAGPGAGIALNPT
jgi:hypothetical protein